MQLLHGHGNQILRLRKEFIFDYALFFKRKTFIENPNDPSILLRLPMAKAAVKAMDAVTDFVGKRGFGNLKKFMVAGASKV